MRDRHAGQQHVTSGDGHHGSTDRQPDDGRTDDDSAGPEEDPSGPDARCRAPDPRAGAVRASPYSGGGGTDTPGTTAHHGSPGSRATGQLPPPNQRRELLRAWRILPEV